MISGFIRNLGIVFNRDLEADFKRLPLLWRVVLVIVFAVSVVIFVREAASLFTPPPTAEASVETVAGGPAGIAEDYVERATPPQSPQTTEPTTPRFVASADNGLAASFDIAAPGRIVGWQLYFAFTTPCERDLEAELISPAGRRLIVMSRGLGRCSGSGSTFSSLNDDDAGAFAGSSGDGRWTFTMRDIDKNGHEARLDALWMTLQVERNGAITPHVVTLEGLPQDVPQPE